MAAFQEANKNERSDKTISERVIRRLPRYYRFLGDIMQNGTERISSRELSEKMGLTASQIRQDLNCFGGFGQQGYGYNVEALHREIGKILGQDKPQKAVLIGAGSLGTAVGVYMDTHNRGILLCGVFDTDERKHGKQVGNHTICRMEELEACCAQYHPTTAVLCVPKSAVENMIPRLMENGIRGVLNFSHYDIALHYPQLKVENVHISDSLMTLRYMMSDGQ